MKNVEQSKCYTMLTIRLRVNIYIYIYITLYIIPMTLKILITIIMVDISMIFKSGINYYTQKINSLTIQFDHS